ncbi:hypothetical protein SLE2022_392780 [Rubroshorea leprosula]
MEEWLAPNFKLNLGDRRKVRFWKDAWAGGVSLANAFPRLFLLTTDKSCSIRDMALWTNGGWSWNFQWKRPLRAWEDDKMQQMLEDINHIKLMQDAEDTWSWRIDTKGKYTTRSAYEQLTRKEDTRLLEHKKLWGAQVPSKVSAFSWQLLLDRIPTKVNLAKHRVVDGNQNSNCVWCDSFPEHTDHLFLSCNTSFKLWTRCLNWWGLHYALGNTCMDVFRQHI